jgi:tetratricopeptide (TPR) repeat protein
MSEFKLEWNERQNERPLIPLACKLYRMPGYRRKDIEVQDLYGEMPYLTVCAKIVIRITEEAVTLINTSHSGMVWVNGELIPGKTERILKRNDLISTRSMNWVITDHDLVRENPFKVIINERKEISCQFMMMSLVKLHERINKDFTIHVHDTSFDASEQKYIMKKISQNYMSGKKDEVYEETRKLIEAGIEDTEIYNMHALALESMGRIEEAKEMYKRALLIEPDHPGILHNLRQLNQ